MTNIIVTAMLLLGGSAVVNALTGMSIFVASFLIPIGVIVYTLAGGLKVSLAPHSPHLSRCPATPLIPAPSPSLTPRQKSGMPQMRPRPSPAFSFSLFLPLALPLLLTVHLAGTLKASHAPETHPHSLFLPAL